MAGKDLTTRDAVGRYSAIRAYLETRDDSAVDCRWSIFEGKWIAFIEEFGRRPYRAAHQEESAALEGLDREIERHHPTPTPKSKFYARDFVVQALLARCGGEAWVKIPAGLSVDERAALLNALLVDGVQTVVSGETVSLSLVNPPVSLDFVKK